MIILDTDHLTVLQIGSGDRYQRLLQRIANSTDILATTIINVEEQMRGWLASIARERRPERQIHAYQALRQLFAKFAVFEIAPFDEPSAARFVELRSANGRLGSQDLKIAAITLAHDALLLTANRRDFEQVPGLRFANWLD